MPTFTPRGSGTPGAIETAPRGLMQPWSSPRAGCANRKRGSAAGDAGAGKAEPRLKDCLCGAPRGRALSTSHQAWKEGTRRSVSIAPSKVDAGSSVAGRPVKKAPGVWAVIATPGQGGPLMRAPPANGSVSACARDRHRMAETNVPQLRGKRAGSVSPVANRARSPCRRRASSHLPYPVPAFWSYRAAKACPIAECFSLSFTGA